ncbi:flagellar motor switch protein FliN [Bermanella marisrubri]|uniref:Flagellar motor switch protein FliN n=1 Tax=Bermanella marisrubri TaxID=207949 RepID=Q1N2V5_9GAMM|nr:flagellar motor switch protein FliN [Bermanella marisrubri]EAT12564.1 flagellar motor switch protein [Oceanobacter sp. RED65] [Bermanella marisrubri]QIZ84879.1 flagellar motor switch protein FliN [Bermanella marisrubri]
MSDDDQKPEEEKEQDAATEGEAGSEETSTDAVDADALADEVASGVDEASGESEEDLADEWAAAMEEAGEDPNQEGEGGVKPAPMEEFGEGENQPKSDGKSPELDVILDIPVSISMEVGNTQIPIRNLLQLNQGSVIELDRLAGEPLDVLVNGTLIAHGEVVMVNDKFGIRLTDVISQAERIQKLK